MSAVFSCHPMEKAPPSGSATNKTRITPRPSTAMRLTLRFYFIRCIQGTVGGATRTARVRRGSLGDEKSALPRPPNVLANKNGGARPLPFDSCLGWTARPETALKPPRGPRK